MLQSAILDGRDTCEKRHSFQMFPFVSVVRGYRTQGIVLATVTEILNHLYSGHLNLAFLKDYWEHIISFNSIHLQTWFFLTWNRNLTFKSLLIDTDSNSLTLRMIVLFSYILVMFVYFAKHAKYKYLPNISVLEYFIFL